MNDKQQIKQLSVNAPVFVPTGANAAEVPGYKPSFKQRGRSVRTAPSNISQVAPDDAIQAAPKQHFNQSNRGRGRGRNAFTNLMKFNIDTIPDEFEMKILPPKINPAETSSSVNNVVGSTSVDFSEPVGKNVSKSIDQSPTEVKVNSSPVKVNSSPVKFSTTPVKFITTPAHGLGKKPQGSVLSNPKKEEVPTPKKEEVPTPKKKEKPMVVESDASFRDKLIEILDKGFTGTCMLKVGDGEVQVYTIFLTAQSAIFEELVRDNKSETKTIEIEGARLETVQKFVEFVHYGKIKEMSDCVEELFVLGQKYDISELKELCCKNWDISQGMIIDRLAFAFKHDVEQLKEKAINYVLSVGNKGNFRNILISDDWFNFVKTDSALAQKISRGVFEKSSWLK